jgi:Txe/YoeB family toxin of Txe-Axe toxin-antitoxin module
MSTYTIKIKNSAKKDFKKLKASNLRKQFEEIVSTLKEDPYSQSQSFEKLFPKHERKIFKKIKLSA